MIITIDSHLHSNNSHDGKSTIDEMCLVAIEKGLTSICFTEHLEQNPGDRGYGFFNHKKYSDDINRAREKYSGKINILQGIEFSEPHEHPAEFERILKLKFDFVLGSVHNLGDYWAGDRYFQKMHSTKEIWEIHYTEILKSLQFGGFDSVSHLDFPKPFVPEIHEPVDLLDDITSEMVKRNISLEINSSPIRKGFPDTNPSDRICEMYAKKGGRMVTVGSDAHRSEEIWADFERVMNKVKLFDFKVVEYINRKPSDTAERTV